MTLDRAAAAIVTIANEAMIGAIREITVGIGIDPRECTLVAGGGAGGLNAVFLARELGCRQVLVPRTAGAPSATGAHYSEIVAEFAVTSPTTSSALRLHQVTRMIAELNARMNDFTRRMPREYAGVTTRTYAVNARRTWAGLGTLLTVRR